MNKVQKLKRLKHQRQKAAFDHKVKANKKKTIDKLLRHGFQEDTQSFNFIIGIDSRSLNNPAVVHNWRENILHYLVNNHFDKPHSRIALNDYDLVEIEGIVSDVIWDKKKKMPRILVDRPQIIAAQATEHSPWQIVNRSFDSHIWLMGDQIIGTTDDFPNVITVTPGDVIKFQGLINSYQTKQNGFYIYKTGITQVIISACGVYAKNYASKKSKGDIYSGFNRHGDWVLKIKHLPHISQIKAYLNKKVNIEYYYQKSNYSNYYERMKEGTKNRDQ